MSVVMMTNLVAVYGTLRKGFHNNYLLESATLVGKGFSVQGATMYSAGGFPILDLKGDKSVVVEVYDVPPQAMRWLDQLEGYPEWYDRTMTDFLLDNGETVSAWIYHQQVNHQMPIVESGDWAIK